ncbi:hypothetical protein BJX64DRAFT_267942 [Aspergillus heterothallicus]
MAQAATDALTRAKDAITWLADEHPVYATLLAIGVLAILPPWVIETLGFGELGPIEGSFAASCQRLYEGDVLKQTLFGFLQRVGMKWHLSLGVEEHDHRFSSDGVGGEGN